MRRTNFFLVLIALLVIPLVIPKIIWLLQSRKTVGIFAFEGHGNALEQIRFPHSEIYFKLGNDTIWFKGPGGLKLKSGDKVALRYLPHDPSNASLNNFKALWGGVVVYGGIILLVLLAVFAHPEIVPYRKKVMLTGRKPFMQLV